MVERIALMFVGLCLSCGGAGATELNASQVQLLRDTAVEICKTGVELKGDTEETRLKLKAEVELKLTGALKKIADASVGGGGEIESKRTEFVGLTQEATGTAVIESLKCRQDLFKMMFQKLSLSSDASQQTKQWSLDATPCETPKSNSNPGGGDTTHSGNLNFCTIWLYENPSDTGPQRCLVVERTDSTAATSLLAWKPVLPASWEFSNLSKNAEREITSGHIALHVRGNGVVSGYSYRCNP